MYSSKRRAIILYCDGSSILLIGDKLFYAPSTDRPTAALHMHKDEINQKRNEKMKCQCGGSYTLTNRAAHTKTTRHMAWMAKDCDDTVTILS